ncbi:MAG: metal ABC transporter permease [Verrucomicrobiia bacterium]|jgi:ABC-type Mn2+/Zn2+ transport system permease subunit
MFEFLQYSFMQRALAAAALLSPLCALLGVFVISRKMSFFSDTVGHSALAGVAIGILIGLTNPTITLLITSLLVAILILWLRENTDLMTDTIMALLFSLMIAVAIIIFSALKGHNTDLHRYLFGDILSLGTTDLIILIILFIGVTLLVFIHLNDFVLVSANEELARVCDVNVRRANYIFALALTLVVAFSIRLLGIILVTSLLVIPAAASRNISKNLRQQLLFSVVFGFLSATAGTIASYYLNLPGGPCITIACVITFILSILWKKIAS